jgi:hypothetical protein
MDVIPEITKKHHAMFHAFISGNHYEADKNI